MTWLQLIHFTAGLLVLAEALNKLERTAPLRPGLKPRERATEWLKAVAWSLLALGGAGAVISPALPFLPVQEPSTWLPYLLPAQTPTLPDVCVIVGFAVLIVRTRVKEG
ncbi:MAG: hypothetical protein ACK4OH_10930 [Acidovorax temperans]|uniref:hypothetical protein n=1 Tax=Acidovorax temperans TaxID=80878 RepID=UPI00391D9259